MSALTLHDRSPGELLALAQDTPLRGPLERLIGGMRTDLLLKTIGPTGFRSMSVEEIVAQCGFSFDLADRLVAARDLAEAMFDHEDLTIGRPVDVLAHLPRGFRTSEVERLIAFALDNRVKGAILLAQGGAAHLSVSTADILRPLVRLGAQAFVLVHNHPSSDPCPSREDVTFTNRIVAAARVVGMTFVDHIVVTAHAHISFAETGLMPQDDERPF